MMGRSMLAYIPVNLANIIASFGMIVVLTRLLNGEEFGRYALAMISMQFAHMGFFTWLEAAMARFQARAERENDVRSHLKTIYFYALATGAAGFALLMVIVWAIPVSNPMKTVLTFALASTSIQIIFNLGMEAHKAAHRVKRYSLTYSTQTLLSFTLGIILVVATPLREVAPYIGMIIAICIGLMIDLPFMLKRMKGGVVSRSKAKTNFNYGMPICISLLLAYALNSADMYLIAIMMGEASAGQYNAGYNLANRSLDILFIWISMAVTPIAVTLMEKEGVERSRDIMKDYGTSLLWIAMPAATGIALVSKEFGFILGESVRAEAVTVMPLIAFAGVLNGLISYYVQRAFMLSGKTAMFMWAMVPPVILNIGLNIWLIPLHGIMGAVYATVISYALGFVLALAIGRRIYPLPVPIRATLEIGAACACMAAAVLALPDTAHLPDFLALIIKAGVGASVYSAVCIVTNAAGSRTCLKALLEKHRLKALTK